MPEMMESKDYLSYLNNQALRYLEQQNYFVERSSSIFKNEKKYKSDMKEKE